MTNNLSKRGFEETLTSLDQEVLLKETSNIEMNEHNQIEEITTPLNLNNCEDRMESPNLRAEELERELIENNLPEGFAFVDNDLVYEKKSKDKTTLVPISSKLEVIAYIRDSNNENHGRLLRFKDTDSKEHFWLMPMKLLAGTGKEIMEELLKRGLKIYDSFKVKHKLLEYIQKCDPIDRIRSVSQIGWHDKSYILPNVSIGNMKEKVILDPKPFDKKTFDASGTLKGWQEMASLASKNPVLQFAISCAFAPPLLKIFGEENGGFHFKGRSSTGKTTILHASASVWGAKNFTQSWRSTMNALEAVAAGYNDSLLCLDEMGQMNSVEIGDTAYSLANGVGKSRLCKTGKIQDKYKWRIIFLSTGEISMAEHMNEVKKNVRAGQEIRILDIPVDGYKYGCFDSIGRHKNAEEFVEKLRYLCSQHYGLAGIHFLKKFVAEQDKHKNTFKKSIKEITEKYLPEGSSAQVQRAFHRFAFVAAAGELATSLGITGWKEEEAIQSAICCFQDWLKCRGSKEMYEEIAIESHIRLFFEKHGESRFTLYNSIEKEETSKTFDRVGYRKETNDGTIFYVFPESFKREICRGYSRKLVIEVCRKHNFLDYGKDSASKSIHTSRKKSQRFYVFLGSNIFKIKDEKKQNAL